MKIFDTHSHLFEKEFEPDLNECITRVKEKNITLMLVGYSHEANQHAFDLKQRISNAYSSAGLHPSEASINYDDDLKKLELFIQTHKVEALGEFGLDYYYPDSPDKELQKKLFIKQMDMAYKYDLPVIIHTRSAWADTLEIIKMYKDKVRGIIHCYSGSLEMAREFIKLGYYIAIGGAVTFKNANSIKEVVKEIDISHLLVETDCPYITPVPFRGKRNESSFITYTIEEIAKLKNMDVEELENITYKNACKVYRIEE